MTGARRIRVGIIGANPDRGWAAQAHIPALKSLSDDFEITALSTSRRESADAAAKRFGVPLAFDNYKDLVNSGAVDVVAVTVKVPYHLELATAALDAGKAVYCEWPPGNGLNEAEARDPVWELAGTISGTVLRGLPAVVADAYCRPAASTRFAGQLVVVTCRIHAEPTRYVTEAFSPNRFLPDIRCEHGPPFSIDYCAAAARTLALAANGRVRPYTAVIECSISRIRLRGLGKAP